MRWSMRSSHTRDIGAQSFFGSGNRSGKVASCAAISSRLKPARCPIVMTSVAFIAGTVPLVLSHGAGAEVRSATGITVFAGMIGVTLFGLFLTPLFYVGLRKLSGLKLVQHGEASLAHG